MRLLMLNRKGNDVAQWQQFLTDQGFNPGAIDGFFGGATRLATIAFQKQHNIPAGWRRRRAALAPPRSARRIHHPDSPGLAVHSSAHDEDDVIGHIRPDITIFETRDGGAVYCKTGMTIDADGCLSRLQDS